MAYQVHLSQFEGPLDLLLHLIERAELDIKDIFVSEITAEYLSYMDAMDGLDMDTASEFLTMAATLLYIKSRQLLPRPPQDEEEQEDPEQLLIRQLRDYKAFKEAGALLEELFASAGAAYTRLPEDVPLPPREIAIEGVTTGGLYEAFLGVLSRANREKTPPRTHHVRPDAYTVRRQMARIRTILSGRDPVLFTELFDAHATRMEMIVTFMALLEMIAHSEIVLHQKKPFAPIRISAGQLMDDADGVYDYLDETEA